jgi:hypothetical protein
MVSATLMEVADVQVEETYHLLRGARGAPSSSAIQMGASAALLGRYATRKAGIGSQPLPSRHLGRVPCRSFTYTYGLTYHA